MRQGTRRAAEFLEIPAGVAGDELRLELVGSRLLQAENHRGIRVYQPDRIVFLGKAAWVEVRGAGLSLQELSREKLVVAGSIESVALKAEGGGEA